uniref:Tryptophan synthase beta chain-like PALP domain-containing protein n=1 Tax=Pyricularia oryzae (strain 70-15 / ATCC MYA-4617 / FGSC 8958) TaxID=242507 RepID=Q2KEE1_PYRO7|nr:hypothetical protein MGCH7_ch7g1095 [Pyricularia oryzae 70-15]
MQKCQVGIVTICTAIVGLPRQQPPLRVELASVVTPQRPGSVRGRGRYQQLRPPGDGPAEEDGVGDGLPPRGGHRRVEAQDLAAKGLQIGQGVEVALADLGGGVGRRRKAAAHLVPQPGLHLGAAAELHEAPGQRARDRLVPGDQEGHALVDEALVVKGARALGDRDEVHRRRGLIVRAALGLDHGADDAPDGVHGRPGADVVLDGQPLQPKDGEEVGQRLEEGHCHVGLVRLEEELVGEVHFRLGLSDRVEVEPEPDLPDVVERDSPQPVTAGAGTVMLEAEEDHGVFDTVVVPLGGGGLAAGVGAWCAHNSPRTNVVCTHPEIFGRKFAKSEPIASQLVSPTAVSYSDGLAVQLARETPFARILQETIRDVVQVTEAETAVAISIALRMQSLLIEGSAATTIAALLKPEAPETRHIKGRVLLLLTGGNIASSSLARSLVSEVSDAPLRQAIGLRNILPSVDRCGSTKLPVEDVGEQKLDASKEKASDSGDGARALADDTTSSLEQWQVFSDRLQAMIKATAEQMQEKDELSARLCLEQDPWCKDVYNELQQVLYRRAKEFEAAVKTPPSSCQESQVPKFWVMEERYRILLQQHSAVACLFDRASAANDQSLRDWFRDFDSQSATVCNYDRYGSSRLRATEQVLAKALALGDTSGTELLLTSSGMAAYQVVQHFLLQSIGDKGNFVLPPYVYFEGMEQLQAFDFVTVTHAPTFDAQDIIATAEAVDAKVVFLDAVANVVDLPATDVRDFCRTVAHRPGWGDRIVVMDGTTASGAMPVFDWMQGRHAPTLLYFESASKYLQFGMDLQMGGLVVYPSRLDAAMRTIRRNTGGVMYSRGLSLLPPLDRAAYQRRMAQLSRNAEVLRDGIAAAASDLVHVRFPSEWKRFGWRHGGALVTVRFLRDGLNNKDGLEACIDLVLAGAKAKGLAVTKGVLKHPGHGILLAPCFALLKKADGQYALRPGK